MTSETTDGFTVTTVEQQGSYVGQEVGRIWLIRRYGSTWWGLGNVVQAREACQKAKEMTADDFEKWMDEVGVPF